MSRLNEWLFTWLIETALIGSLIWVTFELYRVFFGD